MVIDRFTVMFERKYLKLIPNKAYQREPSKRRRDQTSEMIG